MSPLTVRTVRPDDLDSLQTLYRQLSPASPEPEVGRAQAAWAELLADPKLSILVAERDGQVLGTVTLVVVPNLTQAARPYALIENVVTREDARGQGLGTALMAWAMDLAEAAGAYKVMLITGRSDEAVHRLYRNSGLNGERARAYFKRFG